jgi:chaperone required for assembly of F1-ATPase
MKRFYKTVTVSDAPFRIMLDGRPVKTPARAALEAIAEEWRVQGDEIAPGAMALTKLANTALDRVGTMLEPVRGQVMHFANDLLCYRADHPAALVARQSAEWDPLLAWAAARYGVRFEVRTGIVHFSQSDETLTALRTAVAAYDPFALTALATVAPILGSLVLTLALAEGHRDAEAAFALSQLDDRYQAERWGQDEEAATRATALLAEVKVAESFLRLAGRI